MHADAVDGLGEVVGPVERAVARRLDGRCRHDVEQRVAHQGPAGLAEVRVVDDRRGLNGNQGGSQLDRDRFAERCHDNVSLSRHLAWNDSPACAMGTE